MRNANRMKATPRWRSAMYARRIEVPGRNGPLTQAELAALVGVSPNYLSMMERSPKLMSDALRDRVAKALKCRPDELRE